MKISEIRLLHLIKRLELGGIENSTISYSNELSSKLGFVGIFSEKGFYNYSNIVNDKVVLFHPIKGITKLQYFFLNLMNIHNIIRDNNINTVFYHHRFFIPFAWFIKKFNPNVKILYSHHSVFNDFINRFIYADYYIAVSDEAKKDLEKYKKNKITVIPHGIDINKTRQSSNVTERQNIAYIGRFARFKGIYVLLDAFRTLIATNSNYRLILRGDGKELNNIRAYIVRHNIIDKVRIYKPEYSQDIIYKNIDLLVLPSLKLEGFGLVLLEAMINKIPVIGSNVGGIKNVIKDGYNGMLFKPGNSTDLSLKIKKISHNRKFRKTIITNAYNDVVTSFSLENCINMYIIFFTKL